MENPLLMFHGSSHSSTVSYNLSTSFVYAFYGGFLMLAVQSVQNNFNFILNNNLEIIVAFSFAVNKFYYSFLTNIVFCYRSTVQIYSKTIALCQHTNSKYMRIEYVQCHTLEIS